MKAVARDATPYTVRHLSIPGSQLSLQCYQSSLVAIQSFLSVNSCPYDQWSLNYSAFSWHSIYMPDLILPLSLPGTSVSNGRQLSPDVSTLEHDNLQLGGSAVVVSHYSLAPGIQLYSSRLCHTKLDELSAACIPTFCCPTLCAVDTGRFSTLTEPESLARKQ